MKKFAILLLTLVMCFVIAACGNSEKETASPEEPLDLTGTWTQVDGNSDDTYQEAKIEGNEIIINWISDGGDTESLYWAGSYKAPTEATDEYVWTSKNDTKQTSGALLASGDETKEFTYKDGQLSYKASALGSTTTVKLEKK